MSDPNTIRLVFLGAVVVIWWAYVAGGEKSYPDGE